MRNILIILAFITSLGIIRDTVFVDEEHESDLGNLTGILDTDGLTAGNGLFVSAILGDTNAAVTITDTQVNTYVSQTVVVCCTSSWQHFGWYVENLASNGDNDITFTELVETDDAWQAAIAIEISGGANSSAVQDTQGDQAASVTTITTTNVTCTSACMLFVVGITNRDLTLTSSGTNQAEFTCCGAGLEIIGATRRESSAGDYNFSFSLSPSGVVSTMVFAVGEEVSSANICRGCINNGKGGLFEFPKNFELPQNFVRLFNRVRK